MAEYPLRARRPIETLDTLAEKTTIMTMSTQDAIREAEHRLAQQQPGRPLAMTRAIVIALLAAAKREVKPATSEADESLIRYVRAIENARGMAPSRAAMVEEMKAHKALVELGRERAGFAPIGRDEK